MDKKVRFSDDLKKIINESFKNATEHKLTKITTFDVLSRIICYQIEKENSGNQFLKSFFIETLSEEDRLELLKYSKEEIKKNLINAKAKDNELDMLDEDIVFSSELSYVIEDSVKFSKSNLPELLGTVTTEVLLYFILDSYDFKGTIIDKLDKVKLKECILGAHKHLMEEELPKIAEKFSELLGGTNKEGLDNFIRKAPNDFGSKSIPEDIQKSDEENFEKYGDSDPIFGSELNLDSKTPFLDQFSVDMTKEAKLGLYDPIIGREDMINSIIEILCKRKKANVAIIGVAGSGKSSIVERLAQRISENKVPDFLKDKRICSLDLNNLVAGTKFRGEYEERLQKIIKEVCDNKNIIIYIDELHNLVGSGSTSGNGDGANILKPYLARGEFQCIGSTTIDEYRKFIEKDAALNRRFTQVELKEPTIPETIKILNGIKLSYEKFHKVRYSKEVVEKCVEWSSRYITDKHQPDKAIDILDLSGSLAVLLNKDNKAVVEDEDKLRLKEVISSKIKAITKDFNYELGEQLSDEEMDLKIKISDKERNKDNKKNWIDVSIENVATAISKVSKVPIDKINQTDQEKIKKMKDELSKLVVGQDKAITEVVKHIQRAYLGLRLPGKPIFTGLFVGNTGTGKTLICKEIARIFLGSESNLIKIDCGELRERGSVSKLLGTTAGYVGYGEQAPLLDQVKRKPNSVLLLDEIEKCDPSIYEIFMNILDEGYCVLGDSTRVDFTNTIIIFTGNVGTRELREQSGKLGFIEEDKSKKSEAIVRKSINKTFKPEFINRLNSIVIFNELGRSEMSKIYNIELNKNKKLLKKNKYNIKVSDKVKNLILDKIDYRFGARDLTRLINSTILDPITESIGDNPTASTFEVVLDENNLPKVISE